MEIENIEKNLGLKNYKKNWKPSTCSICGENLEMKINFLGQDKIAKTLCKCRRLEQEEKEKEFKKQKKEDKLSKYKRISIIDEKSKSRRFEDFEISDEYSSNMYKIAKKFVDNFENVKKNNAGLYIYGGVGVGKTFLTDCIANALENEYTVFKMRLGNYLDELKSGYSENKEREFEILNALTYADLVIIDDLGVENITNWSIERIFKLIDRRLNSNKPIIITSNNSLEDLKDKFSNDGHNRIGDRLKEACLDIEYKGESRRGQGAKFEERFRWLYEKN